MMALSRNTLLLALAMIGGLPELCAAQEYIGDTPAPAVSTSGTPQATTATPSAANANSPNSSENSEQAPVTNLSLSFNQLLPSGILELRNALKTIQMDFGVRSDQIVTDAKLHLIFTPSPAMLPIMSQIKVYMNDELMQVIPIQQEQMGKEVDHVVSLNPRFIKDFNTVRFELIGHYNAPCEDPLNNVLWADLSRKSRLDLNVQTVALSNDLSLFPEPFFDARDVNPLQLPFVFASMPSTVTQQAASALASWFGAQSKWRGQTFPVSLNQLPEQNAIVFATNSQRPDFLRDYPPVEAPTVEIISHPQKPYIKLLLVLGRDDADLLTAAQGISLGTTLLRGQSTTITEVKTLLPRQPYDAPNWVRTDRPIPFSELMDYPQQLQVSGLTPNPITLTMNVPPDLFTWRSPGIPLNLQYRYTPPVTMDSSRLNVSINDQFVQAFLLRDSGQGGSSERLRLPILTDMFSRDSDVLIPALKIGSRNQLRFDFAFGSYTNGGPQGMCVTNITPNVHAAIEPSSTIDFSGYHHYIAMPDLRAFANVGYPFTRLADLSQTLVLMPAQPTPSELGLLLSVMGKMGASTGYPAVQVSITDNWQQAKEANKDLLLIGQLASGDPLLQNDHSGLIEQTRAWLNQPLRQVREINPTPAKEPNPNVKAASRVDTRSEGNIAAMIGFESPFGTQRSVVAMLASNSENLALITQGLNDSGKVSAMSGSVVVFRDGQINSERVGELYYVGQLPWWMLVWYHLSSYPLLLALIAAVAVVLVSIALWNTMRWVTRRRLDDQHK